MKIKGGNKVKTIQSMAKIGFVALIILMSANTVSSSLPTGGTLVTGNNSTNIAPVSPGSINAAGGYVTEINMTPNYQQTPNWQGFWGNITGGIIYLNDSSGHSMYNWSIQVTNNGFVYATTKATTPVWSDVTTISTVTLDTYWGMTGKSDSIANTYTNSKNLVIAGYAVNGAKNTTVNTYFNDSVISDAASPSGKNNVIWVGEINNDKTNFKTTTTSDYELLVPVNPSDVYNFYVELS